MAYPEQESLQVFTDKANRVHTLCIDPRSLNRKSLGAMLVTQIYSDDPKTILIERGDDSSFIDCERFEEARNMTPRLRRKFIRNNLSQIAYADRITFIS